MERVALLLVAAACIRAPQSPAAPAPVSVSVRPDRPAGISRLESGVTHTQTPVDRWGGANPQAFARAREVLAPVRLHNQHIMGWGALNPEPTPGRYDWQTLDARMDLIRALGGTPVLTLCGAPDWMKGGEPGQTDWSRLEAAPLPEHYDDFARLCARVAERYPQVGFFQVWNEMKGFWDAKANNWNIAGYTDMYNKVHAAIREVRPDAQIGGLYLVVEGTGSDRGGWAAERPVRERQWTVIDHWLEHNRGADFICLDRGLKSFHDKHEYSDEELMSFTPFFADIARAVRERTDLPVWWSEYYGAGTEGKPAFGAAQYASIYLHMITSGAAAALLWNPMQGEIPHGLFTDTDAADGGQLTPHGRVFALVRECFGPGTPLVASASDSPAVEVLASAKNTLLVNKRDAAVPILLNGAPLELGPYEVRLIPTADTAPPEPR